MSDVSSSTSSYYTDENSSFLPSHARACELSKCTDKQQRSCSWPRGCVWPLAGQRLSDQGLCRCGAARLPSGPLYHIRDHFEPEMIAMQENWEIGRHLHRGAVGVVVRVVHRPRIGSLSDSGGRKTPGADQAGRLASSTEADWGGRSHGSPGHGVALPAAGGGWALSGVPQTRGC